MNTLDCPLRVNLVTRVANLKLLPQADAAQSQDALLNVVTVPAGSREVQTPCLFGVLVELLVVGLWSDDV